MSFRVADPAGTGDVSRRAIESLLEAAHDCGLVEMTPRGAG